MDYDDCEEDYEADEDSRTQTTQGCYFIQLNPFTTMIIFREKFC